MEHIHAVVVDPSAEKRLTIQNVDTPASLSSEAVIQVKAISLNLGEVRFSMNAEAGWRPGWDLAGIVEHAAADGSGPPVGARVDGVLKPQIEVEESWTNIADVAQRFFNREIAGKAVLLL